MEHFWGPSILKPSVHSWCFFMSHPYFRVPIHFHKNKIFVLQEFILLSFLIPITATNLYFGILQPLLGPADCGQMNRELCGRKTAAAADDPWGSKSHVFFTHSSRPSTEDNQPDMGVELLQNESTVYRNHRWNPEGSAEGRYNFVNWKLTKMCFLKKAAPCSLGLTSSNYPNKTVGACVGEKIVFA